MRVPMSDSRLASRPEIQTENAKADSKSAMPRLPWLPAGHPDAPYKELPACATSPLVSAPCTQKQLSSREFVGWRNQLKIHQLRFHRKDWEWAFICQALHERGCIAEGKRGLGFAVGREGLPALFASLGCRIFATDMPSDGAADAGWIRTHQHCAELDALNLRGLCPAEIFRERVAFRPVDMRRLPSDLTGFDFLWSSCSMEHLGDIAAGLRFVRESLKCLVPGGIAVHTTEYNCDSNTDTLDSGPVVLYRRRDIEGLAAELRREGHAMDVTFGLGEELADKHIQKPPYTHDIHLKLQLDRFVATSYALIVRKAQ